MTQHGFTWNDIQCLTEAQLLLLSDACTYTDVLTGLNFYRQRIPLLDAKEADKNRSLRQIEKQVENWRLWFSGKRENADSSFVEAVQQMRKRGG